MRLSILYEVLKRGSLTTVGIVRHVATSSSAHAIQVLRLLTSLPAAEVLDAARGVVAPRSLAALIPELLCDHPWYLDPAGLKDEEVMGMPPALWRLIMRVATADVRRAYVSSPEHPDLVTAVRIGTVGDEEQFSRKDYPDIRHPPHRRVALEAGGIVKPEARGTWWRASPRAIWIGSGDGAVPCWRTRTDVRRLPDDLRGRGRFCKLDSPDDVLSVVLRILRRYASPRIRSLEATPRHLNPGEVFALSARLLLPCLAPSSMTSRNVPIHDEGYAFQWNPWFHALHVRVQALLLAMGCSNPLSRDEVKRLARQVLSSGLGEFPGSDAIIKGLLDTLSKVERMTPDDGDDEIAAWLGQRAPALLNIRIDTELGRLDLESPLILEGERGRLFRAIVGHVFLSWAPLDHATAPVAAV